MNENTPTPLARAGGQTPGWNQNANQAPNGTVTAVNSWTPVPLPERPRQPDAPLPGGVTIR